MDYMVLADRLMASPLYRRLVPKSYAARCLLQRVYDLWMSRD